MEDLLTTNKYANYGGKRGLRRGDTLGSNVNDETVYGGLTKARERYRTSYDPEAPPFIKPQKFDRDLPINYTEDMPAYDQALSIVTQKKNKKVRKTVVNVDSRDREAVITLKTDKVSTNLNPIGVVKDSKFVFVNSTSPNPFTFEYPRPNLGSTTPLPSEITPQKPFLISFERVDPNVEDVKLEVSIFEYNPSLGSPIYTVEKFMDPSYNEISNKWISNQAMIRLPDEFNETLLLDGDVGGGVLVYHVLEVRQGYPLTSNYRIKLGRTFNNIYSIKLISSEIPNASYTINSVFRESNIGNFNLRTKVNNKLRFINESNYATQYNVAMFRQNIFLESNNNHEKMDAQYNNMIAGKPYITETDAQRNLRLDLASQLNNDYILKLNTYYTSQDLVYSNNALTVSTTRPNFTERDYYRDDSFYGFDSSFSGYHVYPNAYFSMGKSDLNQLLETAANLKLLKFTYTSNPANIGPGILYCPFSSGSIGMQQLYVSFSDNLNSGLNYYLDALKDNMGDVRAHLILDSDTVNERYITFFSNSDLGENLSNGGYHIYNVSLSFRNARDLIDGEEYTLQIAKEQSAILDKIQEMNEDKYTFAREKLFITTVDQGLHFVNYYELGSYTGALIPSGTIDYGFFDPTGNNIYISSTIDLFSNSVPVKANLEAYNLSIDWMTKISILENPDYYILTRISTITPVTGGYRLSVSGILSESINFNNFFNLDRVKFEWLSFGSIPIVYGPYDNYGNLTNPYGQMKIDSLRFEFLKTLSLPNILTVGNQNYLYGNDAYEYERTEFLYSYDSRLYDDPFYLPIVKYIYDFESGLNQDTYNKEFIEKETKNSIVITPMIDNYSDKNLAPTVFPTDAERQNGLSAIEYKRFPVYEVNLKDGKYTTTNFITELKSKLDAVKLKVFDYTSNNFTSLGNEQKTIGNYAQKNNLANVNFDIQIDKNINSIFIRQYYQIYSTLNRPLITRNNILFYNEGVPYLYFNIRNHNLKTGDKIFISGLNNTDNLNATSLNGEKTVFIPRKYRMTVRQIYPIPGKEYFNVIDQFFDKIGEIALNQNGNVSVAELVDYLKTAMSGDNISKLRNEYSSFYVKKLGKAYYNFNSYTGDKSYIGDNYRYKYNYETSWADNLRVQNVSDTYFKNYNPIYNTAYNGLNRLTYNFAQDSLGKDNIKGESNQSRYSTIPQGFSYLQDFKLGGLDDEFDPNQTYLYSRSPYQSNISYTGNKLVNANGNQPIYREYDGTEDADPIYSEYPELNYQGITTNFSQNESIVRFSDVYRESNFSILGRTRTIFNKNSNIDGNYQMEYDLISSELNDNFRVGDIIIGLDTNTIAAVVPDDWNGNDMPDDDVIKYGLATYLVNKFGYLNSDIMNKIFIGENADFQTQPKYATVNPNLISFITNIFATNTNWTTEEINSAPSGFYVYSQVVPNISQIMGVSTPNLTVSVPQKFKLILEGDDTPKEELGILEDPKFSYEKNNLENYDVLNIDRSYFIPNNENYENFLVLETKEIGNYDKFDTVYIEDHRIKNKFVENFTQKIGSIERVEPFRDYLERFKLVYNYSVVEKDQYGYTIPKIHSVTIDSLVREPILQGIDTSGSITGIPEFMTNCLLMDMNQSYSKFYYSNLGIINESLAFTANDNNVVGVSFNDAVEKYYIAVSSQSSTTIIFDSNTVYNYSIFNDDKILNFAFYTSNLSLKSNNNFVFEVETANILSLDGYVDSSNTNILSELGLVYNQYGLFPQQFQASRHFQYACDHIINGADWVSGVGSNVTVLNYLSPVVSNTVANNFNNVSLLQIEKEPLGQREKILDWYMKYPNLWLGNNLSEILKFQNIFDYGMYSNRIVKLTVSPIDSKGFTEIVTSSTFTSGMTLEMPAWMNFKHPSQNLWMFRREGYYRQLFPYYEKRLFQDYFTGEAPLIDNQYIYKYQQVLQTQTNKEQDMKMFLPGMGIHAVVHDATLGNIIYTGTGGNIQTILEDQTPISPATAGYIPSTGATTPNPQTNTNAYRVRLYGRFLGYVLGTSISLEEYKKNFVVDADNMSKTLRDSSGGSLSDVGIWKIKTNSNVPTDEIIPYKNISFPTTINQTDFGPEDGIREKVLPFPKYDIYMMIDPTIQTKDDMDILWNVLAGKYETNPEYNYYGLKNKYVSLVFDGNLTYKDSTFFTRERVYAPPIASTTYAVRSPYDYVTTYSTMPFKRIDNYIALAGNSDYIFMGEFGKTMKGYNHGTRIACATLSEPCVYMDSSWNKYFTSGHLDYLYREKLQNKSVIHYNINRDIDEINKLNLEQNTLDNPEISLDHDIDNKWVNSKFSKYPITTDFNRRNLATNNTSCPNNAQLNYKRDFEKQKRHVLEPNSYVQIFDGEFAIYPYSGNPNYNEKVDSNTSNIEINGIPNGNYRVISNLVENITTKYQKRHFSPNINEVQELGYAALIDLEYSDTVEKTLLFKPLSKMKGNEFYIPGTNTNYYNQELSSQVEQDLVFQLNAVVLSGSYNYTISNQHYNNGLYISSTTIMPGDIHILGGAYTDSDIFIPMIDRVQNNAEIVIVSDVIQSGSELQINTIEPLLFNHESNEMVYSKSFYAEINSDVVYQSTTTAIIKCPYGNNDHWILPGDVLYIDWGEQRYVNYNLSLYPKIMPLGTTSDRLIYTGQQNRVISSTRSGSSGNYVFTITVEVPWKIEYPTGAPIIIYRNPETIYQYGTIIQPVTRFLYQDAGLTTTDSSFSTLPQNGCISSNILSTQPFTIDGEWYTRIFYKGHPGIQPKAFLPGNNFYPMLNQQWNPVGINAFGTYSRQKIYICNMKGQLTGLHPLRHSGVLPSYYQNVKPVPDGEYDISNTIREDFQLIPDTDERNLSICGYFYDNHKKFTQNIFQFNYFHNQKIEYWKELPFDERLYINSNVLMNKNFNPNNSFYYNSVVIPGFYLGYGGIIQEETPEIDNLVNKTDGYQIVDIRTFNNKYLVFINLRKQDLNIFNKNTVYNNIFTETYNRQKVYTISRNRNSNIPSLFTNKIYYEFNKYSDLLENLVPIGINGIVCKKRVKNPINLNPNNYVFLSIPNLSHIVPAENFSVEYAFAKILLPGETNKVLYNTFVGGNKTYYDQLFNELDELEIAFITNDGFLFDFNGSNHSFALEITELIDKLEYINPRTGNLEY